MQIVTSFLIKDDQILLLKRSGMVKTMQGLWSGISGVIEQDETPLQRAEIEIFEEVGIVKKDIQLVKESSSIEISSAQYPNQQWQVYPFLFKVDTIKIKLNWENSQYKWINPKDISKYETVPSLDKILAILV